MSEADHARCACNRLAAEFEHHAALIAALRRLRAAGVARLDAVTPYPSHALMEALSLPRSRVPIFVGLGALASGSLGYFILWWTQVIDYPLNVGGRPNHAVPAFVPLTFESAVLGGAILGFLGFLWLCRLPRLWRSLGELPGIERATSDRHFALIELTGNSAHTKDVLRILNDGGALRIERLDE